MDLQPQAEVSLYSFSHIEIIHLDNASTKFLKLKGVVSYMHCFTGGTYYLKRVPIKIIVHYPSTPEAQHELENQVARVHADFLLSKVKGLSCPSEQKLALIESIIDKVNNIPNVNSSFHKTRTV